MPARTSTSIGHYVYMLGSSAGVGVFVFEVRAVCFPRPLTVSYQSCTNRQEVTTSITVADVHRHSLEALSETE